MSSSSNRAAENLESNLFRSPNNHNTNTSTQCEAILKREEINFKVDKIASVCAKLPHKQRMNELRNLLPEIEATNWMYTLVSELIGCSATQSSPSSVKS